MNAPREIHILHLEDRATEAELVARELKNEGLAFDVKRVWTEEDFAASLKSPALDLILADCSLPAYDGFSALKLTRKERPEVPFILVSGTLGEETAIDALRDGATDYVLKQRLYRLGPAVRRALKEAQEQKQLEQMDKELHLGEERLRLALEAGQTGAWEFDMISGTSWRTPRCDQIFGYDSPPPEWNYEIFLKHVVPGDLERVKRSFAQASPTDLLSLECQIARPGQEPRWIAIQGRVRCNMEGEPVRLMGTVSDISERKLMERALRESERHFRLLADNVSDVIWTMDATGRFTYISPSIQLLLGYSVEEALSLTMEQMLATTSATLAHQTLDEVIPKMQSGERVSETLELNFTRKDGSTVWCDVSCSGMFDSSGGFVGIVGVSHDITERKQAIESQMRLVTALEQAEEIIVITDMQGTIFYVNPAFERITGYTRQEAIGQNPRILKSGRQCAAFYQQMWDTLTRGEVWRGRLTNKRKDGSFYQEDAIISPVRDGMGHIVNYIALKLDVTHQLELEAQLRQSQKLEAIGTLAGGIAHEINNPVNGIMNYAQLITDELPADHRAWRYANKIMKETDRVALIVRNLLSFARQDKQGSSLANLNVIINATLSLIQTVIRHDQINLIVEVPPGLPQMVCRSQQIEQVLMNLLTNARDALNEKYPAYHEDKIIRVSAHLFEKSGKSWVRTTVEDHGNGIPAEIRDRIFDHFYTTKPTGKGTGLGLSISHSLIEEHGGRLLLETEVGRYARFHMDLPLEGGSRS